LEISGDANDYVGKGLSGGTIVVAPPPSVMPADIAARARRSRAVVCQGEERVAPWLPRARTLGCAEVKLCRPYDTDVASGQFCAACTREVVALDKQPDHRRLLWLLERADDLCQKGADRYKEGEQVAHARRRRLARMDFETEGREYTDAELEVAAEKKKEVHYISQNQKEMAKAKASRQGTPAATVPETNRAASSLASIKAMMAAAAEKSGDGLPLLVFYNKYEGDTHTRAEREQLLGLKYITGRNIRIQEVNLSDGNKDGLKNVLKGLHWLHNQLLTGHERKIAVSKGWTYEGGDGVYGDAAGGRKKYGGKKHAHHHHHHDHHGKEKERKNAGDVGGASSSDSSKKKKK
jgi:hypothetical protein